MTSLTDFLLARIAEDEAAAQAVTALMYWSYVLPAPEKDAWTVHLMRNNPGRVLAESEAKRRVVEQAAAVLDSWDFAHGDHPGLAMWPDVTRRERAHANNTLRALARPFADHPDYREEWKP